MINFSFVLPTRNKINDLNETINSFINLAKNKDGLEFLVVMDVDDTQVAETMELFKNKPVRILETLPTDNFCNDYINWATWKSYGKNLWVITDDVLMETQNWDEIILNRIGDNEYYLVDTWDTTHEDEGVSFPRFPLISRKAIELIGFFLYPQVRFWPADGIIHTLYNSVNAVIKCHEVKLNHKHIPNADPSKSRFWKIFQEDKANGVFPVNVAREKFLLQRAIENK